MSKVQVEKVTTKVTKQAVLDFYNNPEMSVKEFREKYTKGDGTTMTLGDLKTLLGQLGLDLENRPKKVKTVFEFELVDDNETNSNDLGELTEETIQIEL